MPTLIDIWLSARKFGDERELRLDFSDDYHIAVMMPVGAPIEVVAEALHEAHRITLRRVRDLDRDDDCPECGASPPGPHVYGCPEDT